MARKGSVLVVDDEEIMRDVLETVLSSDGYRVDLAKTGEENDPRSHTKGIVFFVPLRVTSWIVLIQLTRRTKPK